MAMAAHMSENMGALLAGVICSGVLLGVSLVQTFYYYTSYPADKWYLKTLVAITAVLDTAHQLMTSHTVWFYLIENFNNPGNLDVVIWSVILESLCTNITGALVQLDVRFYVMRIWLLCKNRPLTGFILLMTLASAGMGLSWVILAMQPRTWVDMLSISRLTITVNALSAVTDVVIAGTLVFLLHRARTGFKKSDTMINRLILFVVNTGVLTSCCALAALLALVASPFTLLYAPMYLCLGRLYTNSLLATLNARESIKNQSEDNSHMLVSIPQTLLNTHHSGKRRSQQNISIKIETTQERDQPEVRLHRTHNLDSKHNSDDALTDVHDTPPRSATKERQSQEYGSNYAV